VACAQGRRATRLRYGPTRSALLILKYFRIFCSLLKSLLSSVGREPMGDARKKQELHDELVEILPYFNAAFRRLYEAASLLGVS
jgi:hypothetical protein